MSWNYRNVATTWAALVGHSQRNWRKMPQRGLDLIITPRQDDEALEAVVHKREHCSHADLPGEYGGFR
jgi:hypothetical protein